MLNANQHSPKHINMYPTSKDQKTKRVTSFGIDASNRNRDAVARFDHPNKMANSTQFKARRRIAVLPPTTNEGSQQWHRRLPMKAVNSETITVYAPHALWALNARHQSNDGIEDVSAQSRLLCREVICKHRKEHSGSILWLAISANTSY